MGAWKPITEEIRRKVLVTNNIDARDAHGQMSHVWIVILVQKDEQRGFVAMDDSGWRMIESLSHYAEIPQPSPENPQ